MFGESLGNLLKGDDAMNYTKKAIVKPARTRRSERKQSGFTLIEILVVMAIIAMLAVMVAPNILNQQAGAQRDAAISQISSLQAALDMYRLDTGEYPDGLEGLVENDTGRASWNGPYLRGTVPADPWGNNYVYNSGGRDFTLISFGPDGEQGGEGDDADIGL